MKNPEFKVRRVTRYRVPKYPSHLEPDPTLHPRPVAFPWKYGVVAAWLGLSASGFGQQQKVPAAKAAETGNPLAMEKHDASGQWKLNGLPHRTSPFGTGAPSYLSDAEAVQLIRKIFQEQGFPLRENVPFRADGVEFQADGYDPQHKVGFVFVNYDKMGEGMLNSWEDRGQPGAQTIDEQILAAKTPAEFHTVIFRAEPKIGQEGAAVLRKMLGAAKGPNARQFLEKYSALKAEHDQKSLSLAEAGVLAKMEAKEKTFIAIVSQVDVRFMSQGDGGSNLSLGVSKEELDPSELKKPKPEHTPLGQLERAVREYIAWARRNGLQ